MNGENMATSYCSPDYCDYHNYSSIQIIAPPTSCAEVDSRRLCCTGKDQFVVSARRDTLFFFTQKALVAINAHMVPLDYCFTFWQSSFR